ncbi:methyl-accepting chemotaxis protein [Hydrogenovibrio sp. SC-1]|uniref:methyl-accepting chemotaxis protein n=1 Tax=Hydrogenovibrio sp. SC-1 TaxID=2065820 RepID=UPI000C7DFF1C|nr:methyl-accepting chemotaxis protein [Hydrogenovibrio sp. SC-1]PLA74565.1 methyl-accepting chemotaxis protein [Hydrogenovibrio sp. SC-1]
MLKTIRAKLLASFIFITLLVIGMSIFSISQTTDSANGFKDYREMARDTVLAGQVQSNMLMVRMSAKTFMSNPGAKEVEQFNHYYNTVNDYIKTAKVEIQKPERAKMVTELDQKLQAYNGYFEALQTLAKQRLDIIENNLNKNGRLIELLISGIQRSAHEDKEHAVTYAASASVRTLLLGRIYAIKFMDDTQKSYMDRAVAEFRTLQNQLKNLEESIKNPARRKAIQQVYTYIETYISGVNALNKVSIDIDNIVKNNLDVIGPQVAQLAENIKISIKKDQDRIGPEVQSMNDSIITALIVISIIITLVATLIAIFIPKAIATGIQNIQTTLERITDSGDFSVRADDKREDELGHMGQSINALLSDMQNAIIEANKVISAIADGNFDQRVTLDLAGDLNTLKQGINNSADSINTTMTELGRVMEAMNNGQFNVAVNADLKGDFLTMMNNVRSTMEALNDSISDIVVVMNAMQEGEFNKRVEADARGELLSLKQSINHSMDALENAIEDTVFNIEAIASGDLTHSITNEYHGQLLRLKNSINQSNQRLSEVVTKALNATSVVSGAAEEVSQGSINLSQRVQENAAAAEETSATMEEMSSAVTNNTEHAKEATSVAHEVQQKSNEGVQVMQKTIEAMNAIQESSHKISDIVSLIDGIAFQTNLLALNAAVEAARAGDHGRGFAVVAGEVRSLAQKAAEAAKDITNLINESVTRIDDGTKLATESGEMLTTISASVDNVTNMIEQIADASAQQMAGIQQANTAITQIDEVTQQNAALVEETSAAAESLSDQARILQEDMAFFTVKNSGQSTARLAAPKATQPKAIAQPKPSASLPTKPAPTSHADKEDEWDDF